MQLKGEKGGGRGEKEGGNGEREDGRMEGENDSEMDTRRCNCYKGKGGGKG